MKKPKREPPKVQTIEATYLDLRKFLGIGPGRMVVWTINPHSNTPIKAEVLP